MKLTVIAAVAAMVGTGAWAAKRQNVVVCMDKGEQWETVNNAIPIVDGMAGAYCTSSGACGITAPLPYMLFSAKVYAERTPSCCEHPNLFVRAAIEPCEAEA